MKTILAILIFLILFFRDDKSVEWAEYLGGPDRNHYSTLNQINTGNVNKLEKAWE